MLASQVSRIQCPLRIFSGSAAAFRYHQLWETGMPNRMGKEGELLCRLDVSNDTRVRRFTDDIYTEILASPAYQG